MPQSFTDICLPFHDAAAGACSLQSIAHGSNTGAFSVTESPSPAAFCRQHLVDLMALPGQPPSDRLHTAEQDVAADRLDLPEHGSTTGVHDQL